MARRDRDPDKKALTTLKSMEIGIVLSVLVLALVGVFIVKDKLQFALGAALGCVVACGMAVHIYVTIDKALDLPEDKSSGYVTRMALLRLMLMGIPVLLACFLPGVFNVLGVLLGLTGLKLGAYLQPGVLKIINKPEKKVKESAE